MSYYNKVVIRSTLYNMQTVEQISKLSIFQDLFEKKCSRRMRVKYN